MKRGFSFNLVPRTSSLTLQKRRFNLTLPGRGL
jgi:hypothetical protein